MTDGKTGTGHVWRSVARAFGGAILFSLPLLMTMEMWWLGFYMDRFRLALLLVLLLPVLAGLSRIIGFEPTHGWREDLCDACIAYAVGTAASAAILLLFNEIRIGMPFNEIAGKVFLQAVPASIGAMLARSELGETREEEEERRNGREPHYGGELFLLGVGALFFTFNLAPTEEMILIAYKMNAWHALALAAASVVVMHAFVYAMAFKGQHAISPDVSRRWIFLTMTVAGYAVALAVSLYILWTFGRTDGLGFDVLARTVVVLGFPASIGAAAARLIL